MLPLVSFLPASETILRSNPSDRLVGLICLIMFFAGVVLACQEVVVWWKARMKRFEPPPFARLITYEVDADRGWRPTKVFWFRLRRTIPVRLQSALQEDRATEVSVREKPIVVNMEASSHEVIGKIKV